MDNTNLQNQVNGNTFNQNNLISDKHIDFMNRSGNTPQTQPPQQVQQQKLINPSNFEQVLGHENVVRTEATELPKVNNIAELRASATTQAQIQPTAIEYNGLVPQGSSYITVSKNETMKLVLYVVPVIAIFFLILKPINDNQFLRHVKQSLVAQAIWFLILFALRLLDLPIIDPYGIGLWNIVCIILMLTAGIRAYNHEFFEIPVAYELGKSFIEDIK